MGADQLFLSCTLKAVKQPGAVAVAGAWAACEPRHLAGAAEALPALRLWPGVYPRRFLWSLVREKLLRSCFSFSLWNGAESGFVALSKCVGDSCTQRRGTHCG